MGCGVNLNTHIGERGSSSDLVPPDTEIHRTADPHS